MRGRSQRSKERKGGQFSGTGFKKPTKASLQGHLCCAQSVEQVTGGPSWEPQCISKPGMGEEGS